MREALAISQPVTAIDTHYYSVRELSKLLNFSENTIRRLFTDEPGVLKLNELRGLRSRPHVTLRVPQMVLERVMRRLGR